MRYMLPLGLVLFLPTIVRASDPDPRRLLEQADAALHAARSLRYTAQGDVTGDLREQLARISGTVTIAPVVAGNTTKIRVDGDLVNPRETEPRRMQLTADGKVLTLIDHKQKLIVKKDLPASAWMLTPVSAVLIRELGSEKPFEREVQAQTLEYVGSEKVGEVECDVIRAVFGAGEEVRWALARNTHLPYRVERTVKTPVAGVVTTTISELKAGETVGDDAFALAKPEGYQELGAPPAARASGLLAVGADAPDWKLKDSGGKELSLKSLRGKVVLLDFWATWCGPCRMAMPAVQRLHDKYKDKPVAILGMNCWEKNKELDPGAWMKQNGFSYPVIVNSDSAATDYKVRGIPTFYVIDPQGKILFAGSGMSPGVESAIEQMIAEQVAKLAGSAPGKAGPESKPAAG
jgi:thiol-disulfide isomerase/thioredoxin